MKYFFALLFSLLVLIGCAAPDSARATVRKKADPVTGVEAEVSLMWGAQFPENVCGCIVWVDANGNPLQGAPSGEIRNGAGGGVVPEGAKGFKITLEPCEGFDGCANGAPTPPTEQAGTPGPAVTQSFWKWGALPTGMTLTVWPQLVSYDVYISDVTRVRADEILEEVLSLDDKPDEADIRELIFAEPRLDQQGKVDGYTVTIVDDIPIDASSVSIADKVLSTQHIPSTFLDAGYYVVTHEVNLREIKGRNGEVNVSVKWQTADETLSVRNLVLAAGSTQ